MEGVMTQPGARLVMPLLATHGELSGKELAEMTRLKAPSISAILKKMEDEGLVERKSNPNDKREVRVSLTPKGAEVDRSIIETLKSTDEAGLKGLTDDEQTTLMTLLCRIQDNLISASDEGKLKGEAK
jgi:DNA-binding MarR family transcriptional regulator